MGKREEIFMLWDTVFIKEQKRGEEVRKWTACGVRQKAE